MNELQVYNEEEQGWLDKLEQASQALTEATTDFERMEIRDAALGVQREAKSGPLITCYLWERKESQLKRLKREDIQVQASILVQKAERAIAKANPPMSQEESLKRASDHSPVSRALLKSIQKAHTGVTDAEFDAVVESAVDCGEPMTRYEALAFSKRNFKISGRNLLINGQYFQLGSRIARYFANMFDFFFLPFPPFLAMGVFCLVFNLVFADSIMVIFGILCLFWMLLLFLLQDGMNNGQSFGKFTMSMRVVDARTGGPCRYWQSAVRNISRIVFFIDPIMALGWKRQRLGDKAAQTFVVKGNPPKNGVPDDHPAPVKRFFIGMGILVGLFGLLGGLYALGIGQIIAP